ncbi:DUF1934 domain-containing protein [Mangrovibacillus cuniculi]|uniref:DUF1934 domain-containing protein n=1 Tax=Mangrovibacillus cuniculi TaxID=2593652 RepID=A0A7S8CD30_9BACI|nr:DUF1934 domain-containing protein [Mangrovibacillus cuniculi]QPC47754.1 DUF1934 domain-containing protein [Mangrovibacillus cuniculi]
MATNKLQTAVRVKLLTSITIEQETESYELQTTGTIQFKNGSAYLHYDEVQENGTVNTLVKVAPEKTLIQRRGAVNMRLSFNKEIPLNGSYDTPQGTLLFTTETNELKTVFGEEEGSISVDYELFMNEQHVGSYKMDITYKEDETA